jgi:hypothetical protein
MTELFIVCCLSGLFIHLTLVRPVLRRLGLVA